MPHKEVKNKKGERIPSVTQILGILNKPHLFKWYGTVGWDECERIKRESAEYGTRLHEIVSSWLKDNIETDLPILSEFVSKYRESRCIPIEVEPEEPYVSKKYGYSGTFDWIEKDPDGLLVIADLKVTNQIYKEMGLQLAAYMNLWNESHEEKVTKGRIYRLDKKTRKLQIKEFPNLEPYWKVFKLMIPVFKWTRGNNE